MDLKEENALAGDFENHWYYVSKGRALRKMLGSARTESILDVGAGSGVFAKAFIEAGIAERAVCIDPNYTDEWLSAHRHEKMKFVRSIETVESDLVILIDVLEHVDDDVELLKYYADRAAPGTKFLMSVPAFQFLWSSHDEFLEHRQRYTLAGLRDTATKAGLQIEKSRYFFGSLFPVAAVARIADRLFSSGKTAGSSALGDLPGPMNAAMIKIHDVERVLMFPWNQMFGVSGFSLGIKPSN